MTGGDDVDWQSYRRHILAELQRFSRELKSISDKLDSFGREDLAQIKVDIAMLKVKAGMWGGVAGALVVIGVLLVGAVK